MALTTKGFSRQPQLDPVADANARGVTRGRPSGGYSTGIKLGGRAQLKGPNTGNPLTSKPRGGTILRQPQLKTSNLDSTSARFRQGSRAPTTGAMALRKRTIVA